MFIYVNKKKSEFAIDTNFYHDFKIRWNTSYIMLTRFLMLKRVVNDLTYNANDIPNLGVDYKLFLTMLRFFRLIYFYSKEAQKRKLSKLCLSNGDWELVSILINLLKPFYMASTLLQTQNYHTLSTAKIIESVLRKFFEKKLSDNCSSIEKQLSKSIVTSLNKYLDEKITQRQKNTMLVISFMFNIKISIKT